MHNGENIPLYFKIYHKMRQSIISGEFEKGSRIGIVPDLANQYGVAHETLRRALCLLEEEGLLIKKQGVGTQITERTNLSPIELSNFVKHKQVLQTLIESKIFIYSAEWVKPSYRLTQLYGLERGAPDSRIYRVFLSIDIAYSPGLKGLMTHHVSENLYKALGLGENVDPRSVLLQLAEWLETKVIILKETLRPHLCLSENANLLGLTDGTPVFFQEFFVRDNEGRPHFWEFISTANIHARQMDLC
ncbi:MAG: GntR family transcriptional regulator [Syntrophobacteraceae bacterium]